MFLYYSDLLLRCKQKKSKFIIETEYIYFDWADPHM